MPDDNDNNDNNEKDDECPFCHNPMSKCDCNLQGTH